MGFPVHYTPNSPTGDACNPDEGQLEDDPAVSIVDVEVGMFASQDTLSLHSILNVFHDASMRFKELLSKQSNIYACYDRGASCFTKRFLNDGVVSRGTP